MARPIDTGHQSTVRWHEQMFLWSCHLYYVEDKPVLDDNSFDHTVKVLDLNQELWSPVFRERILFLKHDMRMSLKVISHAVTLCADEVADAHTWAGYVRFLRRFASA